MIRKVIANLRKKLPRSDEIKIKLFKLFYLKSYMWKIKTVDPFENTSPE